MEFLLARAAALEDALWRHWRSAISPRLSVRERGRAQCEASKAPRADGMLQIWDIPSGRERIAPIRIAGGEIQVALSADGKRLATLTPSSQQASGLRVWDASNLAPLDLLPLDPVDARRVAFTPDGRFLATAGDAVRLYGLGNEAPVQRFKGEPGFVRSIAVSPDGKTIATAGGDRVVHSNDDHRSRSGRVELAAAG